MKTNYLVKQLLGTLIFFSILFISAGRIAYWQGLIYVLIGVVMIFVSYTLLKIDPELSKERSKPGDGAKKWDKTIMKIFFLVTVSMYITAGLDSGRNHWSPDFHWSLAVLGGLLTVSGQLIFLIAQKQNKFFSSLVRIQSDRNHVVCETGLYKIVRHPAYLGSIIQAIGFPMLFGSVWSIIPCSIQVILFIIRTFLEDTTLKNELDGYVGYASKTRDRLIPYVW